MKDQPYHLRISPKTKFFNFFRGFFIFSGFDKMLAEYTRHKKMNSFAAKLIPPNYLYPAGSLQNCKVDGINFQLDISDTVDHTNYFNVDEPSQQLLYQYVQRGMVVIDIGANIGVTALNFAKRVSPLGKVFSFEPSAYNYQKAAMNISLNNFLNITLINQGLGNEKTTAFLYNVNPNNRGMQRLLNVEDSNSVYEKTAVEIDTLDCSMQKFSIAKPSLIKIDVEGYEYKVIQGGKETIRKYKPALFIELDDDNLREQGSNAAELVQLLHQLQYKIINAATGNAVNENKDFTNCHFDILCTAL